MHSFCTNVVGRYTCYTGDHLIQTTVHIFTWEHIWPWDLITVAVIQM